LGKVATTKLSSRGQVVIPEEVRNRLHLTTGMQFVVIGAGDAIILKTIALPEIDQYNKLMDEARTKAREVGLKQSDIESSIKRVRKGRRQQA
jgi:AbrB family looped-hinge helix DNA binding protein